MSSCGNNVELFSELPEDILLDEILPRLPVKSLIRFTVVCKFWYDLIRSPNFITLHHSISTTKRVPFYYNSHSSDGCYPTTKITLRFFYANAPLELTLPRRVWVDSVRLVGCYNGIVCLSLTNAPHKFALWNPATKQSRLINLSQPRGSGRIYSGFFFDSIADPCKLVRATFLERQKPGRSVCGILNIFTLNDNKWRNKELLVPCRIPRGGWDMSGATCLSTCMYWIVTSPYYDRDKYIICLDVVDEVFKRIIEFLSADHFYCNTELFDYKGSLAMLVSKNFYFDSTCYYCDIWVLNDDSGGNWHKQLTLRLSMPEVMQHLGFISNECNDLVHLYTYPPGQFLLWDTDSGKTTKVFKRSAKVCPFFLYSESFASV